jgi:hypothetical protein
MGTNFLGNIDEIRIWNGAMDQIQAQASYQKGPDAASPIDTGALSSISMVLNDPTMVAGTIQRPKVTAQYANVSNIDLTFYPQVILTSSDTNTLKVISDAEGAQRIQAVAAGSANVVASFGGQNATNPVTVIAAPAGLRLTHRWSFNGNMSDFVGNATPLLLGQATVSNNGVNLTGLKIPTTYVELGADLISGFDKVTLESFTDFRANAIWANLLAFGERNQTVDNGISGLDYIFVTPAGAGNNVRAATQPLGGVEGLTVGTGNLNTNNNVHIVVTVDSTSNVQTLYTNGVQAATATNVNFNILGVNNRQSILGRSFFNDPNLNALIKDFRIWYGIMDSNTVALSRTIGADPEKLNAATDGLGNTVVSWADFPPLTDGWTLQRSVSLSPTAFTNVGVAQVTNAGQVSVTVPNGADSAAYFRLVR